MKLPHFSLKLKKKRTPPFNLSIIKILTVLKKLNKFDKNLQKKKRVNLMRSLWRKLKKKIKKLNYVMKS